MRRYSRRSLSLPVLVTEPADDLQAAISFDAADLSQGGAFLRSELLFEVGEVLDLEIHVAPGLRVRARGRVVRVSRAEEAPGMGIEFVELSPDVRQALAGALGGASPPPLP
jgi:c-di-GMP-binding flagellar brake protein YcgR